MSGMFNIDDPGSAKKSAYNESELALALHDYAKLQCHNIYLNGNTDRTEIKVTSTKDNDITIEIENNIYVLYGSSLKYNGKFISAEDVKRCIEYVLAQMYTYVRLIGDINQSVNTSLRRMYSNSCKYLFITRNYEDPYIYYIMSAKDANNRIEHELMECCACVYPTMMRYSDSNIIQFEADRSCVDSKHIPEYCVSSVNSAIEDSFNSYGIFDMKALSDYLNKIGYHAICLDGVSILVINDEL